MRGRRHGPARIARTSKEVADFLMSPAGKALRAAGYLNLEREARTAEGRDHLLAIYRTKVAQAP